MAPDAAGDRTQQLLDALSSPVRREILWLVWERELTAGEIAASFALTAPTISSHLGVLRESGLVTMTRDGTFRRYRARQDEVRSLRGLIRPGAAPGGRRAEPEGGPTPPLACAAVVEVDAACSPSDGFRAFTEPALYTRWAGVPVSIVDGRFSTTMEWGLEVRGRYDLVVPPRLIVLRWDFADGDVPLPGATQRGYLEVTPSDLGCRVVVTQLAEDDETAHRMRRAWLMMLGRFRDHVVDALEPARTMPLRATRPR